MWTLPWRRSVVCPFHPTSSATTVRRRVIFKVIGTANKRDDFTRDAFFDYWMNVHAPISMKAPGLRGYVVSEATRRLQGSLEVDAFVEQWFDSEAAFVAASESSEVADAWADVPNYAKLTGSFWVVHEHVIIPPPRP